MTTYQIGQGSLTRREYKEALGGIFSGDYHINFTSLFYRIAFINLQNQY